MFLYVSKNVKQGDSSSKLEPALGFEPRTDGLQNRSSTAELSRHIVPRDTVPAGIPSFPRPVRDSVRAWAQGWPVPAKNT